MTEPNQESDWTDPSGLLLAEAAKNIQTGWYPGLKCWDAEEGFITSADYWDGTCWKAGRVWSHYWPNNFSTEEEAREFALEHDPNW